MAEGEVSLAAQLAGELGAAAWRWVAVLGPGRALDFQREAAAAAGRLALQLGDDVDDNERADTVAGLMTLLWPDSDPPAEWWQETPLGRIGAMSLGTVATVRIGDIEAALSVGCAEVTVEYGADDSATLRLDFDGVTMQFVGPRAAVHGLVIEVDRLLSRRARPSLTYDG